MSGTLVLTEYKPSLSLLWRDQKQTKKVAVTGWDRAGKYPVLSVLDVPSIKEGSRGDERALS